MALSRATNEKRLETCVGNDLVDLNRHSCLTGACFLLCLSTWSLLAVASMGMHTASSQKMNCDET